jgi:hypothetical protein
LKKYGWKRLFVYRFEPIPDLPVRPEDDQAKRVSVVDLVVSELVEDRSVFFDNNAVGGLPFDKLRGRNIRLFTYQAPGTKHWARSFQQSLFNVRFRCGHWPHCVFDHFFSVCDDFLLVLLSKNLSGGGFT